MSELDTIAERLREWAKEIPRPLKVLVQKSEADRGKGRKRYSAMCIQYPVVSYAEDIEGAVFRTLAALSSYLRKCEQEDIHPIVYADGAYMEAFDFGRPAKFETALPLAVHVRRDKTEKATAIDDGIELEIREPVEQASLV